MYTKQKLRRSDASIMVAIKTLQFMQSRWKGVVVDVLAVFPPTISDTFYCTKYIIQIPVNP